MRVPWSNGAKNLGGVIKMLLMNKALPRWSDQLKEHAFYEDEKHALDGMLCWILAKMMEHEGVPVDFTVFPRIAIYRGFERAAKKAIKDEIYAALIEEEPLLKEAVSQYVRSMTLNLTSEEFVKHIDVNTESLEWRIYCVAVYLATSIELEEVVGYMNVPNAFFVKNQVAEKCLQEFMKDEKLMSLARNFSRLRKQVRWLSNGPRVKFNDLGHSYHVACECYVTLLMQGYSEETATKGFFVGLYHDLAERWTGDFPSPMKDGIRFMKGEQEISLRDIVERLEKQVLVREVYCNLPPYMVEDFKGIMLEEIPEDQKNLFKEADAFSAMVEAKAELVMGVDCFAEVYKRMAAQTDWSKIILDWLVMQSKN